MEKEIDIKVNENSAEIVIHENGTKIVKEVLLGDLVSSLSGMGTNLSTDFLPGEFGTHKVVKKGNTEFYLFSERPRKADIYYTAPYEEYPYELRGSLIMDEDEQYDSYCDSYDDYHEEMETVAPIFVWMLGIYRGESNIIINHLRLFALKTPIITGKETLYRVPFANTYSNGTICWGDVELSSPSIRLIQGLSTKFLSSDFNFELSSDNIQPVNIPSYGEFYNSFALHYLVNDMIREGKSFEECYNTINDHLVLFTSHSNDSSENGSVSVMDYFQEFIDGV